MIQADTCLMTTDLSSDRGPAESRDRPRNAAESSWRPVDEIVLRSMAHARTGVKEMAERLSRPASEVRDELDRLGLL